MIFKRSPILLFSIFVIIFYITSNFIVYEIDFLSNSNKYIEHKVHKSNHMAKYANNNDLDIVIIGASKTQNHINSDIFRNNKVNLYNYGVPAISTSDYPYMINEAIKNKPKFIILEFPLEPFFSNIPLLSAIRQPTLYDLYTHIQSYNITIPLNFYDAIPVSYYLKSYSRLFDISQSDIVNINKIIFDKYEAISYCNIFDYRGYNNMITLCDNGDSTIWYNRIKSHNKKEIIITTLNLNRIRYFNYLIKIITNNNIIPLILIQATDRNKIFKYDNNLFSRNLDLSEKQIIDLSYIIYTDDEWADVNHLNYLGKEKFSYQLLHQYLLYKINL
jgi:hypothetical protein